MSTVHGLTCSVILQVGKPNVGENRPSRVRADVSIELQVTDSVRREWEGQKKCSSVKQEALAVTVIARRPRVCVCLFSSL